MRPYQFIFTILAGWLLSTSVAAQDGIIRGKIIDDVTGEALIGVTVQLMETSKGTSTDFDGVFEIHVAPGTYKLQFSYISYQSLIVEDVVVTAGKLSLIDDIVMRESAEQLEEVVITAEAVRSSEAAVMMLKKRSASMLDGISSSTFRKIGDGDAASAVKRVTGVSVEGGKYVYVRGLGDRYTGTMLNGVDIPGLDPDRNSLQMDIFPTNIIDNMTVSKTAVADMRADFSGGMVNIETKDFPEERIFDISLSTSYTSGMHLNKNYLDYKGGKTDWLGYDDGSRALPGEARAKNIPSPISGDSKEDVSRFVNSFNPTLDARRQQSLMDYSIGLSLGDQRTLINNNKIGYILSLSYKSNQKYYDDMQYGEYQIANNPERYEMVYATTYDGQIGERNVLLGGLAGLAYKTERSKIKLTAMHLQNAESRAGEFYIDNNGEAVGQSGYIATSDNLEFNQRGLTNLLLNGAHSLAGGSWELDWRISPTISTISDPDIRKTAFTLTAVDTSFIAGAGGNPNRIWRSLEELNLVGRVDLTKNYTLFMKPAKLKFGGSYVFKERDYEILSYDVQFFGAQPKFYGDPNNVLTQEHLYPNGSIYYSSGNNDPNPNAYNSTVENKAFYLSNEAVFLGRLRTVLGVRAEHFVQRHTGRDVEYANFGTGNNLDDDKVFDALDFFPSANLIFSLTDNQNIRLSYARTIARPSFKELSFAQILDPITNRIFNGGLFAYADWDGRLRETDIDNLDFRWELFMDKSQLLSVSGFYKSFKDPIELVRIPEQTTSTEYQPRNVGDGMVVGVELEFSKTLNFIHQRLERFRLNGNLTWVESSIEMTSAELRARKNFEKEGQNIKDTRQMAGQAPYIINLGFSYDNPMAGVEAGIYYNVKGPTLTIVGGGLFPDVYAEPFHSLNFALNKTFGPEQRTAINFSISNLLNDVREEVFSSFRAEDQVFTRFSPRKAFSLGFKYSL